MSNYKPVPPQFQVGEVVLVRGYSQKFLAPQYGGKLCIITDIQSYASSHLSPGRQHNYYIRTYGDKPQTTWIVDESLLSRHDWGS